MRDTILFKLVKNDKIGENIKIKLLFLIVYEIFIINGLNKF